MRDSGARPVRHSGRTNMSQFQVRFGMRPRMVLGLLLAWGLLSQPAVSPADESLEPALPVVAEVDSQPLRASVSRLLAALQYLGEPLEAERRAEVDRALQMEGADAVVALQRALDPLALIGVNINPESRVKVARGAAEARLTQHGWSVFLVKVHNEAGVTAPLRVASPQAAPIHRRSTSSPEPERTISTTDVENRWMDVAYVRLATAHSDAVGVGGGVPNAAGLQSRRRETGGDT
jgi:hypothetical protein